MKKWIIVFIIVVLFMGGVTTHFYVQSIPTLKEYGKMEIERFNQLIISHCYFTSESQYEELVIIEKDGTQQNLDEFVDKMEKMYGKR